MDIANCILNVPMALWTRMNETRSGSSLVRYTSQYNLQWKYLLASCWWWKVMFYFNLLFSIKGLWKVNWPVTEQVPVERHQDDITTLPDLFPRSTTQPWYQICTKTHCICILGYVCQVKWWIKMIACVKPTLSCILGDFYMQQLYITIYLFELQSTDFSWLRYITTKTVIVYRQLRRMAHPATQLGSLSSKRENTQCVKRRHRQLTVLASLVLA